ncbi:MAG: hypothetical protein WB992_10230 [Bryobacteraceae bacterium]
MSALEERKRRGGELMKKYRSATASELYDRAADAIADILLFVASNEDEGAQILQCAEADFRGACEGERFLTEG